MYVGQLGAFTNREDWQFPVMDLVDDDTGDAIDLTAATISFGIYDSDGCLITSGETGDTTISLTSDTTFQILIPRTSVTNLCAGTYRMGITVENASQTTSLFTGTVSVTEGNVPL